MGENSSCPVRSAVSRISPMISSAVAAATMGISGSAATQLVDSSVREGLLSREVDSNDRRVMRISLTPSGRRRLESFRKARIEAMSELLAALGSHEIETFRDLLRKIVAAEGRSFDTVGVK